MRTIIEMVNHTRLDCILGSASVMRQGVAQATWHAAHRSTFGTAAGRSAADGQRARRSGRRVRGGHRRRRSGWPGPTTPPAGDGHEHLLQRILTPVVKYWTCKRAPQHAAEALECLGGNGFVEESGMPRLFRQSPVNGVWEGSGNVICLDVLRALAREPDALEAFWAEVGDAGTGDARLARAVDDLHVDLAEPARSSRGPDRWSSGWPWCSRRRCWSASSPPAVADAFCASRLGAGRGRHLRDPPGRVDTAGILARHAPV